MDFSSIVDSAFWKALEDRILGFIFADEHIYLFFGVVAVMALLRYIGPLKDILFTESRKWLAAPINVALSLVGVFALNLTVATTTGMKIIMAIIISTFATFLYEAALKRLLGFASTYLEKRKNGNGSSTPTNEDPK